MNLARDIYLFLHDKVDHMDVIMNTVFFATRVRPGFMIQPIDYNEDKSSDLKTAFYINIIKMVLGKHNVKYMVIDSNQGFIFCNENVYMDCPTSTSHYQQILGYDYELNHNYKFAINLRMSGAIHHIYAMGTNTNVITEQFQKRLDDMNVVVKEINLCWTVSCKITKILDTNILIKKIDNGDELSVAEIEHVVNELQNVGFDITARLLKDHYHKIYTLPNRCCLSVLLKMCVCNPIEMFYPLTAVQNKQYTNIISDWEKTIWANFI